MKAGEFVIQIEFLKVLVVFLLNAINEEIKDNKSNYEKEKKNNSLWQPKLFDKKYMNRVVSIISPEISAEIETSEEKNSG